MQLRYRDEAGLADLPKWAKFLFDVGFEVGKLPVDSPQSLLIGLTTPTRAFGAALCSFGVVAARFGAADNSRTRYEELTFLPVPTEIICDWRGGGKGSYLGTENGFVVLQLKRNTWKCGPTSERLEKVFVPGQGEKALDPVPQTPLLTDVVDGNVAATLRSRNRLDCLIVGTKTQLEAEIGAAEFCIPTQDGNIEVTHLQDVLRVRSLLNPNAAFRSDILSASHKREELRRHPHHVVLDGARAFLRFQKRFRRSHCIVVLDRTEPAFIEARNQLRQEYAAGPKLPCAIDDRELPNGIEMVCLWREVKR
jgi:hypothetical protein